MSNVSVSLHVRGKRERERERTYPIYNFRNWLSNLCQQNVGLETELPSASKRLGIKCRGMNVSCMTETVEGYS
jgi:hypothetical protein